MLNLKKLINMAKKRMSMQEKHQETIIDMINEMFKFAGHDVTYDDIKDRKDDWYMQWTMTHAQYDEWRAWGSTYLKKKYNWNKTLIEREMSMFGLMWGLKFSDSPQYFSK